MSNFEPSHSMMLYFTTMCWTIQASLAGAGDRDHLIFHSNWPHGPHLGPVRVLNPTVGSTHMNASKASRYSAVVKGAMQCSSMGISKSKVPALAGRELAKHAKSYTRRNNSR